MMKHLNYFLRDEGNTPCEYVHEIRENKWVLVVVELLNVESVALKISYRGVNN